MVLLSHNHSSDFHSHLDSNNITHVQEANWISIFYLLLTVLIKTFEFDNLIELIHDQKLPVRNSI